MLQFLTLQCFQPAALRGKLFKHTLTGGSPAGKVLIQLKAHQLVVDFIQALAAALHLLFQKLAGRCGAGTAGFPGKDLVLLSIDVGQAAGFLRHGTPGL